MLDSIEDFEWKPVERTYAEEAYINMNRDVLYVEETGENTANPGTYRVRVNWNYQPPDVADETLHTADTLEEAEAFLDGKRYDL